MVPSIYSVTPSEGLASGLALISVFGWGFRVRPEQDRSLPIMSYPPSVAVYVDGQPSRSVAVLSSTELRALTPRYTGEPSAVPATVNVTVKNLDDAGDPIAGEEVTSVGAFTFRRPIIAPDPATLANISSSDWLTHELVKELRRNLLENVAIGGSPDFSAAPTTQITYLGELPGISLSDPRFVRRRELESQAPLLESHAEGGSTRKQPPAVEDIYYGITLVADTLPAALALRDEVQRYFDRVGAIAVAMAPDDSTEVEIELELTASEWTPASNQQDQTYTYSNTLRLTGVEITDSSGVQPDGVPLDSFFTDEILETDVVEDELSG